MRHEASETMPFLLLEIGHFQCAVRSNLLQSAIFLLLECLKFSKHFCVCVSVLFDNRFHWRAEQISLKREEAHGLSLLDCSNLIY